MINASVTKKGGQTQRLGHQIPTDESDTMGVCWELCGLVSDQHISACPSSLCEAKPVGEGLSLGNDRKTLGQHRMVQRLRDLTLSSLMMILSAVFNFTLSVTHGTDKANGHT